jgi:hypothetical protein
LCLTQSAYQDLTTWLMIRTGLRLPPK